MTQNKPRSALKARSHSLLEYVEKELELAAKTLRVVIESENSLLPVERKKLQDYAGSCMAIRDQLAALIAGTTDAKVSGTEMGNGDSVA